MAEEPQQINPGTLGRNHKAACHLNASEHAQIVAAAAADGRTVSSWLRQLVLAALPDQPVTKGDQQ